MSAGCALPCLSFAEADCANFPCSRGCADGLSALAGRHTSAPGPLLFGTPVPQGGRDGRRSGSHCCSGTTDDVGCRMGTARKRAAVIGAPAARGTVGIVAADKAAMELGVSRRLVYVLPGRYRQGSGLVPDLAVRHSTGGRGGNRLQPVQEIIRDLIRRRFLTRQKRSVAALHREISRACALRDHRKEAAAQLPLVPSSLKNSDLKPRELAPGSWRLGRRYASAPGLLR
jgi:hypothetical protein